MSVVTSVILISWESPCCRGIPVSVWQSMVVVSPLSFTILLGNITMARIVSAGLAAQLKNRIFGVLPCLYCPVCHQVSTLYGSAGTNIVHFHGMSIFNKENGLSPSYWSAEIPQCSWGNCIASPESVCLGT